MPYAVISASASGDNTIVAAATNGRKIRVQNYTFIAAGDVSVTWKSGSVAISGAMPLAANGGAAPSAGAATATGLDGVLETVGGQALVLNLSAAILVAGHLRYEVLS
jgi:hypothetical protein